MRAKLGTAAAEIEHLRAQLAALRRQQYGQSSERRDADITQLELRLEGPGGERGRAPGRQP